MTLEKLESDYRRQMHEIADRLADMSTAPQERRRTEYLAVLAMLMQLQRFLRVALSEVLRKAVVQEYQKIIETSNFSDEDLKSARLTQEQLDYFANSAYAGTAGFFLRSINNVQGLASALRSTQTRALQRVLGGPTEASEIRKRLRERLGIVLATNGKYYHYEPGYYAKGVVSRAVSELSRKLVTEQARYLGTDLVQIVGPPSDHAECSDAINKVFSISGTDPQAPPLDDLRKIGGATFHFGCRHHQTIFDRSKVSESEFLAMTDWQGISSESAAATV